MAYFNKLRAIVEAMAAQGIYTLLDVHQDCLSSRYCLYDGVPLWVITKSTPRKAFPWPLNGTCARPWAENELTEAAGQAYQDLYDNTRGMRDDFVRFWTFAATYFATVPILGYEVRRPAGGVHGACGVVRVVCMFCVLCVFVRCACPSYVQIINEPFAGDIYADPALLLPGVAGHKNLARFYEPIAAAIRAADPAHLVFYEPVTWGMVLNGNVVGSGFTAVPGGPAHRAHSVFSVHYYCWLLDAAKGAFIRGACDRGLGPQVMRAVAADMATLGGGVMVTEYGADTCSEPGECAAVADLFAAAWMSSIFWPDGALTPRELGLSRPYPRALAGRPLNTTFARNSSTADYTLCYVIDRTIDAPTEIFLDFEKYYPHGVTVTTTPNVVATVQRAASIVSVDPAAMAPDGRPACVVVRAAPAGSGE